MSCVWLAEFVLNPQGKSDICILHEYVQHALRQQPRYIYNEIGEQPVTIYATKYVRNLAMCTMTYMSNLEHYITMKYVSNLAISTIKYVSKI